MLLFPLDMATGRMPDGTGRMPILPVALNGAGAPRLSASDPAHDDVEGLQDDGGVEDEGGVGHVMEVEGELVPGIVDVLTIGVIYLCPPGEAGFDEVSEVIKRKLLFVKFDADGPFRPGADETHVAFEDVEELGDLIDPGASEKVAEAGDPGIPGDGGGAGGFGVEPHGAELVNGEGFAPETDALLAEEGGAGAIEPDGDPS